MIVQIKQLLSRSQFYNHVTVCIGCVANRQTDDLFASDSEGDEVDIFEKQTTDVGLDGNIEVSKQKNKLKFIDFAQQASRKPTTLRPRILLAGEKGQGQSTHLAPALLHQLERLPVHTLDLPVLHGNSAKTTEESCAQVS